MHTSDQPCHTHLPPEVMAHVMELTPIPCVDLVLLNEAGTHTLLCKRTNEPAKGVHFTIGGRLWKGETFKACALRKAYQELGIVLDETKLIGPYVTEDIHPNSAFKDVSYHAIPVFFFYICTEGDVSNLILDTQHDECAWLSVDDPSLHPYIRTRLAARPRSGRAVQP